MGKRRKNDEDDQNGFAAWGGYMEAKQAKLQEQFTKQKEDQVEKLSDTLKGIAIFVNGRTKPNSDELKVLMAQHGGVYHTYQCAQTTHIIASNLPNVKINKLGSIPIVKPSWITDSITLGRLLDFSKYLLYTNQSRTQPKLNFKSVDSTSSSTVTSESNAEKTKTASDPSFLSDFYNNSRLHLISTLGAEFKQLVNELREKNTGIYPGLTYLTSLSASDDKTQLPSKPVIMHIDMDCFFVSVGLRSRPELKGKPVAVTHSKGGQGRANVDRSVEINMYMQRLPDGAQSRLHEIDNSCSLSEIASCSYEARACGIKNGMFMGPALKLCPELKAIPYDFQGYKEVSKTLYQTIAEYTLNIEAVSCDEMYVDITNVLQKTGMSVSDWAKHIRSVITDRTGCPCSTGFGANRLQARLATKKAKPNGAFHLEPEDVEEYMCITNLADLPGVGRATLYKLQSLGLETCGDVQMTSLQLLQKELGTKNGETIYEQAKGIDKKPLKYEHERKSVSAEVNYGIRFKNEDEAMTFLHSLSTEVIGRLKDIGMKAKCVTLKVMVRAQDAPVETAKYLGHGLCDSLSKSTALNASTNDAGIVFKEAKSLYAKLEVPFADLRGVGIQLTKLEKEAVVNSVLKNFLSKPSTVIKTNQEVSLNTSREKRGRPKGSKNSSKLNNSSGNNQLHNYFKASSSSKDQSQSKLKSQLSPIQAHDIDLATLQELPEDIRNEIMKEYNLNETKQVVTSSMTTQNKAPQTSKSTKVIKGCKTLESLDPEMFKQMLQNWLNASAKPKPVDVDMLADYCRKLALDRKIERLSVIMKFLHRNIERKEDCIWHEVYFSIVKATREGMLMNFRGTLSVPMKFACFQHSSYNS